MRGPPQKFTEVYTPKKKKKKWVCCIKLVPPPSLNFCDSPITCAHVKTNLHKHSQQAIVQPGAVKTGFLMSLDPPELHASSDIKEPISLHQAVRVLVNRNMNSQRLLSTGSLKESQLVCTTGWCRSTSPVWRFCDAWPKLSLPKQQKQERTTNFSSVAIPQNLKPLNSHFGFQSSFSKPRPYKQQDMVITVREFEAHVTGTRLLYTKKKDVKRHVDMFRETGDQQQKACVSKNIRSNGWPEIDRAAKPGLRNGRSCYLFQY